MRIRHIGAMIVAAGALTAGTAHAVIGRGGSIGLAGRDAGHFIAVATSSPTVVVTHDVATGREKHLGKYWLVASETVDLKTLEVTHGSYTVTTANGDTIRGVYSGRGAPTKKQGVITYLVSGPVTGGTGRFAGASGSLVFDGGANLTTGTLYDKLRGTLSLQGS